MKIWQQFMLGFIIGLVILGGGAPVLAAAPTVTAVAAVTTDTSAGWSWSGSGGNYQYSLDNETDWQETTAASFTPGLALAKGAHTLYVQESDGNGGWSTSGSASLYCLETDGTGTVQIGDAADLTAFSDFVNAVPVATNPANSLTNARLTNDITLTSHAGNPWQPIGKNGSYCYRGVFDGQNHVIHGLYLSPGNSFSGLFGMSRGTLRNITIAADSTISGGNDVGALVGMANSGSQISNCHNFATVSGNTYVGGIAGTFLGTLENCTNRGAVTGSSGYIGGIVGFQQGNITNCFNCGTVRSTIPDYMGYAQIGGISGILFSGVTRNCYNTGMISTAISGAMIKRGAIIGEKSSYTSVLNCYYLDTTAAQGIGTNSADITSETARRSAGSFASGEVSHGLQSGQATPIWGQTLTGSADLQPQLSSLGEQQVHRVVVDYADTTPDQTSYHNPNASVAIPQTPDYAVSLNGASFTASSYTIGSSDATFMATRREDLTGITVTAYNGSFDGSSHPLVTVDGAPSGAVLTYSLSGEAGSFSATLPEITDVGSTAVYVKISDFYHYDYLSDQLTATVTRASAPTVEPLAKCYRYTISSLDESLDVTTLLPADRGASDYSTDSITGTVAILDGAVSIDGNGILSYRVTGGAISDTVTIPVIIASANYDPISVAVNITLTDKEALTIGGIAVSNKTYDGQPLLPAGSVTITDAGGQAVDPGQLSFRYHSTDGGGYDSSVAPTQAGSYALDISVPTDQPSYRGALGPLAFDIQRRPLEIRALNQTITVGGDRPADGHTAPDLVTGETLTGVSYSCDYLKNDGVKGKAGSYPITPSGGVISGGNENYQITYQPGVLTVNPASSGGGGAVSPTLPGVSLGTEPLVFDAAGHLAVDISGLPAGATIYYSSDGLSYGTTAPVMTGVGCYPLYVRISCPGYADYLTRTEVTVAKAAPPPVADLVVVPPADQVDGTVLLATELPPNPGAMQFEIIDVADPEQLLGDVPVIDENGQLYYRLRRDPATDSREGGDLTSSQTAVGATVLIRVTMANYEDLHLTVVIARESAGPLGVRYLTHIQDYGWESDWVTAGALSGTAGQSKRLEALKVELTGDIPEGATIDTAVHVQNFGDLGPFAMGTAAGTSGQSLRLEDITLTLQNLPGYTLRYNVHVQNQGWLRDEGDPGSWFTSGEVAGTSGKSLRLEALRIELVKEDDSDARH